MERWLNKNLLTSYPEINLRKEALDNTRKISTRTRNVKKNRQDTKARVDKPNIISYIKGMKELIEYNKSLLEVADQKLKRLIETEHDINHPGPYFDMVNKQLDYINTLKERIRLINEKTNDSR